MDQSTALYQAAVSTDPKKIYWESMLAPNELAEQVLKSGIAVFPGFLSASQVEALNEEFDKLMVLHRDGGGPFNTDSYGNVLNVRIILDRLDEAGFSATADVFTSPFMAEVAQAYFGDDKFRLNSQIFASEIWEGPDELSKPPFALHFDKRQVLKFFFYLTDTDESNGAMRASPGSHFINRERRLEAMKHDRLNDIANVLPEPDVPSIPIVGSAGTLFVFDTDMCHGASRVDAGKTRRTMRGHTHSLAMLDAMAEDSRRAAAH